ncbi:MAG TPA: hypothetical protein VHD31_01335 [Candidatus Paceibacterota bacterium]|nr:hypothetical protein [Candidatus Paceibacterota bacterium]
MIKKRLAQGIYQDAGIILLSIFIAFMLVESDILSQFLASLHGATYIGSFIAGLFFTSVFTTAPAIAALGEISQHYSVVLNALFGALGAAVGDMLLFLFVRDRFSDHLSELINTQGGGRRLMKLFRRRSFRWLTFMVGGLIIASPLPDELGVTLLGFSKMKARGFIILSLVFNFIGILLVGLAAHALA